MQTFATLAYMPSLPELIIVLVVILILFGPKRLPGLSRSVGKSIGEFKRGKEEAESELNKLRENNEEKSSSPDDLTEEVK